MAADLITLAEGALLTQFLTPTAKHYGEAALKRIQQLSERAKALLGAAGRDAQPIEEKVLFPLVQAAALESDESLAEKWAALLANAADPAQRVNIGRGFVEVLRQLEPADALVLERLYQAIRSDDRDALTWESAPVHTKNFGKELGLAPKQFAVSIDTLLRLRLCALPTPRKRTLDSGMEPTSAATFQVCPTVFGREFLAACTPPAE
ncbi:Abi-alpha family protein [Hymenobacter terrenus]|uniref:Abi-alpha family protein n=1 Tax=Hymenobacter terrenus TaxID=1629124 RepID=UPI0006199E89|nr:Abi-alpha family protein [Hymenobacter terrenus]